MDRLDEDRATEAELAEVRRLAFVAGGRLAQLGPRLVTEVERLREQNDEYVAFIATVVRVPNSGPTESCGRKHLHADEHTDECRR